MKQFFKFIFFKIIDFFAKSKVNEKKAKSLLLVRIDAIGDYILFRNFIEILKNSEKYGEYKITLLGNVLWKQLALEFDKKYVDNFIWLDSGKLEKNFIYRFKKLKELSRNKYDIIINPVFSRHFFFDDAIVKIIDADKKIGSRGDVTLTRKWLKKISDKYYTELVPAQEKITFEFFRNKEFFENLLGEKLDIIKPFIPLQNKILHFDLPENYAILFIGAKARKRKWDVRNFVEIAKFLKTGYGYEIVLCGGPADKDDAMRFSEFSDFKYIDLVGKTSLIDFFYVVARSSIMVSNETVAPHIAVAFGVRHIFVVSNGNHFGRFTPYPEQIHSGYYPVYHPEIEKNRNDFELLCKLYGNGSDLNINDIAVQMLKEKIKMVLSN